ncbi:MAG: hypothetical protein JWN95_486 [Frankiales bacterium]|nr:hypothetical protein [Frankiales bacterium]
MTGEPGGEPVFVQKRYYPAPGEADDVTRIPTREIVAGTVLYRVHKADNDALYFARGSAGRFNPLAASREEFGTCYLATERLTAFVEVFGRTNPISERLVSERVLSEVSLSRPLTVADLTDRALLGRLGPMPEISVGPDYRGPASLAAQLVAQGLDGIRYFARHDPSFKLVSIAMFSASADALQVAKTTPIPDDLIIEAEREFELFVLPEATLD